jgi:hypothetical protein
MSNNIERMNPLQCRKCNGTVLPERAICLRNGIWVLRYICLYCGRRWHAVRTARQWVLVAATRRALPAVDDGDENLPLAIAA